jgi:hypothetical protein
MGMTRKLGLVLFLVVAFSSAYSRSEDFEVEETAELLRSLPSDAVEVVRRARGCLHWQGEKPSDKQRAREIKDALHELECSNVPDDNRLLQTKYQSNKVVIKVLDHLEKYYLHNKSLP